LYPKQPAGPPKAAGSRFALSAYGLKKQFFWGKQLGEKKDFRKLDREKEGIYLLDTAC
jgi:hypothetical protein